MRLSRHTKLLVFIIALTLVSFFGGQTLSLPLESSRSQTTLSVQADNPDHSGIPTPKASLDSYTSTIHERFAPFLAQDGFKSDLLLQNIRLDVPVIVVPALILGKDEFRLDPITLAPHSAARLDINAALQAHRLNETQGIIVVRYDFKTYGAVTAVVECSEPAHHLYFDFVAQSPEEFWYGTTLDAVFWTPEDATEGIVSIINTSSDPKKVKVSFIAKGHAEETQEIEIRPHQLRLLRIDSLVKHSMESGAGIHLSFDGKPGDIVAEGALFKKKTGFTKHIRFMDTALKFPTSTLRTNFLLLGRQPEVDGFPSQVSFRAVAAIRNTDSAPIQVTPVVKYLKNGSVQKLSLAPLVFQSGESRLIDFSQEQEAGKLPFDFSQGSLELVSNTPHTSIVSELFNFNEHTDSYVLGSSFLAHPARATSSIWRIDGTFQTTIVIENTADKDDKVDLTLFSDQGSYNKTFPIRAGALMKINLKELQRNGVQDNDGHLLLATSGTLALAGVNGTKSALAFEKLIHSADESEYVGLLANPCNFVTDIGASLTGDISPFSPLVQLDWSDGSTTFDSGAGVTSSSSLITIDSSGVTINANPDGIEQTASLTFSETTTTCDICSGDTLFSTISVTISACPTTVSINNSLSQNLDLSKVFPTLQTGIGLVAAMQVGPAGNGPYDGVSIQEAISQSSNTCPQSFGAVCGSPTGSFIVGKGASTLGVFSFPSTTNIFYDKHSYQQPFSALDNAGINSCTAVCAQSYSCTGRTIGKFTITKKFTKGTIQNTPVTFVTVTKQ